MPIKKILKFFFGGSKETATPVAADALDLTSVRVGDALVVTGLDLDYEGAFLLVTNLHRYEAHGPEWWEAIAADRTRRLRVEWWPQGDELKVVASTDFAPVGLEAVGITEDDLNRLDVEHSIDNRLTAANKVWHYRNSHEAFFHRDQAEDGLGFWMWDFEDDDGAEVMAVTKFEGAPFEVHFATVIDADDVEVWPGAKHNS